MEQSHATTEALALANTLAAFRQSLVRQGIPPDTADTLTTNFNECLLRESVISGRVLDETEQA